MTIESAIAARQEPTRPGRRRQPRSPGRRRRRRGCGRAGPDDRGLAGLFAGLVGFNAWWYWRDTRPLADRPHDRGLDRVAASMTGPSRP